jgi:hypothetical protein
MSATSRQVGAYALGVVSFLVTTAPAQQVTGTLGSANALVKRTYVGVIPTPSATEDVQRQGYRHVCRFQTILGF